MRGDGMAAGLALSDLELFRDPGWMREATAAFEFMFAQGLEGFTDDCLADGPGSVSFDDLGHFSITTKVVPAISNLLRR